AGPTREHVDPVRVVTNPSSGRMGYSVAEAAYARGADVVLVSGPSDLPLPLGVTTHRVETTAEMQRAVESLVKHADLLVMAAAPPTIAPLGPRPASARARTARSRSSSRRPPTFSPRSSHRRGAWWWGLRWRRQGRKGVTG